MIRRTYLAEPQTVCSEKNSEVRRHKDYFERALYHPDSEACVYIRLLERCRPWILRNKHNGRLFRSRLQCGSWINVLLPSSEDAEDMRLTMRNPDEWEVIQWEGIQ